MKKSWNLSWSAIALVHGVSSCAPGHDADRDGTDGRALVGQEARASTEDGPNVPDDSRLILDATAAEQVAEEVADIYRPFAATHSATISIEPNWASPSGAIGAVVRPVREWVVSPKAALLNAYLTRDVMRMLVCHEMGHFFGGFPFKQANLRPTPDITNLGTFTGSEAGSDYYSTKSCLRRVWAGAADNAAFRGLISAENRARCDAVWRRHQSDRDICYRSLFVANHFARWLQNSATPNVSIDTPDSTVVDETNVSYPSTQCRIDSVVAGALCRPDCDDPTKIPGLVPSPITGMYGHHSVAAENDSRAHSCYEGPGARPACWFKPNMPEFDCGNGVGWTRCEDDGAVLATCRPPDGEERVTCILGCVPFPDSQEEDVFVCAEDILP